MAREVEGRVEIPVATPGGTGRNPEGIGCGASDIAATRGILNQGRRDLMEAVVERENMERALRRVMSNKGVPGVDGLRVEDLRGYCIRQWPEPLKHLCWQERTSRNRYEEYKFPSQEAGCDSWASRQRLTVSSSRQCIRCFLRCLNRNFPNSAMDSGQDVVLTRRCSKRVNMLREGVDMWWIRIWRSSLTE